MFWISITTSTSSLLQSILVKVSVLWYYTNPNGIFRSLFPKFCILRFCDLFQSPSNYLVDEIPLESSASATKKEGSTSKGDDRSRWRKRETRDFFWTPPCWNPPGHGNDWLLLVIHTVILRILSHFLKNFQGKSFCKKPWWWRDSNWGLPGDSPVSLPLYQHNML